MGTLLLLVIGGGAVWFFASGGFKTNVRDAETLKTTDLEDVYIELKKKILVTSVYKDEKEYNRLYYRMHDVLGEVLKRHEHFVLDVEAKGNGHRRAFVVSKGYDSDGMPRNTKAVPTDLNFNDFQSDELLCLCFFLYLGGAAKDIGEVNGNPELAVKILDFLIGERNFAPASFFKGMMLKYGVKVYQKSDVEEARRLLEYAQKNGVGSATVELTQLGKFTQLAGLQQANS